MYPEDFYKHYESNGFFFSRDVLTRYCLALYSKPFVILSGISGTGKTKIAQLFTTPHKTVTPTPVLTAPPAGANSWIQLTVTEAIRTGDGRGNFSFSDLGALFEANEIPDIQASIDRLREQGVANNITDPVAFTITVPGHADVPFTAYLQRASSPLLRARFKSKRGEDPAYDSRSYFRDNYRTGQVLRLRKTAPQRLELVSVDERPMVAAAQQEAETSDLLVRNTCFISVRSDWTDSTNVFGHYSVLEQKYHLTETLRFILTAHEHPDVPFFLIFDEMNLSKVEYYFSDFLSCLESRVAIKGEVTQEPVILHSESEFAASDDAYFDLVPARMTLPANLYVTGTVNIDETTYVFSPKVLDRANVIEFNDVDLKAYESPNTVAGTFILKKFPQFGQCTIAVREHYVSAPGAIKSTLNDLNAILKKYNLHFGYRVANEIGLFINNAVQHIDKEEQTLVAAIDAQIVQKVLPKLNGSFAKLDLPLRDLISYFTGVSSDTIEIASLDKLTCEGPNYSLTLDKLKRMYRSLSTHGFTGFFE